MVTYRTIVKKDPVTGIPTVITIPIPEPAGAATPVQQPKIGTITSPIGGTIEERVAAEAYKKGEPVSGTIQTVGGITYEYGVRPGAIPESKEVEVKAEQLPSGGVRIFGEGIPPQTIPPKKFKEMGGEFRTTTTGQVARAVELGVKYAAMGIDTTMYATPEEEELAKKMEKETYFKATQFKPSMAYAIYGMHPLTGFRTPVALASYGLSYLPPVQRIFKTTPEKELQKYIAGQVRWYKTMEAVGPEVGIGIESIKGAVGFGMIVFPYGKVLPKVEKFAVTHAPVSLLPYISPLGRSVILTGVSGAIVGIGAREIAIGVKEKELSKSVGGAVTVGMSAMMMKYAWGGIKRGLYPPYEEPKVLQKQIGISEADIQIMDDIARSVGSGKVLTEVSYSPIDKKIFKTEMVSGIQAQAQIGYIPSKGTVYSVTREVRRGFLGWVGRKLGFESLIFKGKPILGLEKGTAITYPRIDVTIGGKKMPIDITYPETYYRRLPKSFQIDIRKSFLVQELKIPKIEKTIGYTYEGEPFIVIEKRLPFIKAGLKKIIYHPIKFTKSFVKDVMKFGLKTTVRGYKRMFFPTKKSVLLHETLHQVYPEASEKLIKLWETITPKSFLRQFKFITRPEIEVTPPSYFTYSPKGIRTAPIQTVSFIGEYPIETLSIGYTKTRYVGGEGSLGTGIGKEFSRNLGIMRTKIRSIQWMKKPPPKVEYKPGERIYYGFRSLDQVLKTKFTPERVAGIGRTYMETAKSSIGRELLSFKPIIKMPPLFLPLATELKKTIPHLKPITIPSVSLKKEIKKTISFPQQVTIPKISTRQIKRQFMTPSTLSLQAPQQLQIQKQTLPPTLRLITPVTPITTTITPPPPPSPPPTFWLPRLPSIWLPRGRRGLIHLRVPKLKYKPSLGAYLLGITGKPKKFVTGLGIRPIPKGWKYPKLEFHAPTPFGRKPRRKKRKKVRQLAKKRKRRKKRRKKKRR